MLTRDEFNFTLNQYVSVVTKIAFNLIEAKRLLDLSIRSTEVLITEKEIKEVFNLVRVTMPKLMRISNAFKQKGGDVTIGDNSLVVSFSLDNPRMFTSEEARQQFHVKELNFSQVILSNALKGRNRPLSLSSIERFI